MRSVNEIQREYTEICSKVGHLEVSRVAFLSKLDAELIPLHHRISELQKEAKQLEEFNMELDKREKAQSISPEPIVSDSK
jgi:hypothetical protein